jgi:hypothetical protein
MTILLMVAYKTVDLIMTWVDRYIRFCPTSEMSNFLSFSAGTLLTFPKTGLFKYQTIFEFLSPIFTGDHLATLVKTPRAWSNSETVHSTRLPNPRARSCSVQFNNFNLQNPASANFGALAVFKGARSAKPRQPIGLHDTGKRRAEVGPTGQQVNRTLLPVISNNCPFPKENYFTQNNFYTRVLHCFNKRMTNVSERVS